MSRHSEYSRCIYIFHKMNGSTVLSCFSGYQTPYLTLTDYTSRLIHLMIGNIFDGVSVRLMENTTGQENIEVSSKATKQASQRAKVS